MTIASLTLQGGQYGIDAFNGSTGLSAANLTVLNSSLDGIHVDSGSSVRGSRLQHGQGQRPLTASTSTAPLGVLNDNTVTNSGSIGMYLVNPGNATVPGNVVTGNAGAGI